jgi:hypothetical protein
MDAKLNAAERCVEIAREVRDGFLSEQYATGQPLSSLNERFACDQVAAAIEREFGLYEGCTNCGDPVAENGNYCAGCWAEENGQFGVGA